LDPTIHSSDSLSKLACNCSLVLSLVVTVSMQRRWLQAIVYLDISTPWFARYWCTWATPYMPVRSLTLMTSNAWAWSSVDNVFFCILGIWSRFLKVNNVLLLYECQKHFSVQDGNLYGSLSLYIEWRELCIQSVQLFCSTEATPVLLSAELIKCGL
jgi:hypothetical protein